MNTDLEAELRELRARTGIPALAAVHVSASGIQAVAHDGVRRVGRPDEVASSDRFHLGSNAKALTALVAAEAVERGVIEWDTAAREILGAGHATLRQLLSHSAGLAPYGEDEEIAAVAVPSDGTPGEQRAAFARHALAEEPPFVPGTKHLYSNAGFISAAAMVETVSGEPWEAALPRAIFDPLGIAGRIGWPVMPTEAAPLGHRSVDAVLAPHDPRDGSYLLPPLSRPAGDVSMSIGDYGRFLADQLAGMAGNGRLGPETMYRLLHTPDPADAPDEPEFALGWGVRQSPHGPISMHTGSAGTFYAVVALEPARDRGIAILANCYSDDAASAVNGVVKEFLLANPT